MAERPLYTLYKNLKAQNYDVPDDYNKFESALTRDGKGGADNRHAIYENLKAQNFDVPNTYERFYSALFEPRSKTSSRAKGGSVPMTAADRARFSAGTAAILSSAQHTMNNAGRYNKLKQRKQRQQKDFGRVNLGTHQTPYGGDANNVVKDDFAYNPETGKTGAYVSSDNENVYSQPEAEQKQAVLDQQNNAYQEAVDTGEIPSVFDVRDKNGNYDLQENINKNGTYLTEEGARNQFDKKLADAYARKKEIEALIAEDHRQHGNPLLSYGASIGASNGRTAEQSDYSNKLATSLALVKQQIGALEAVKQYPTSSWGEDALKALDNTAFTAKTWDFGLTDFATMGQMERIKTKMDNNLPLSGSDKMLLKSKLGADAAAALEDEKMGNIYRWTKIAGQSLPFMADFFLTGGYGGITKTISRGALKFAAKRGMGKVSAAILKNTGIVAGDVIGSYAMAGSEQALKTGADIMQRHLGSLYQDEKGDYKFGTFDENGNLLHEGGESMGTALYKGLTSAMVENYTEKLFGHSYGIKKGAINFMEKHGMNASAEFFKNIGKSGWYTNSKKWMEKFGINGFGEEVMEEEIGIPLHALLDGDNKVSDLLDAKQQLDIIGGMALSVGSMYAMGSGSRPVKGVYNRAQYYRFRNKVNVADSDAQNLLGDNWADIKDKIDNATNEQMGSVLADILRQRDTMSKDQINAAINYGVNLIKMRGYNVAKTAEMNAREITNEPTTPEEQHQEDIDNAYSEGHDADDADKHDIQLEHEDQMKTLAGLLNISEQQLSAMNDDELQSLTGQNDKLDQAIYDYQLSSARYQGVTDDAQDKIDMAANQAAQRVDMYTDKSRGSVRNATVKASGGAEDYGVYIISGNIATNEDGSINVADSDDMILFYDPTTNSVEHADALRFAELGDEVPADDVKAQAVADAKEKAIKEVAGIVDGTIDVGSQFNVTGTDGTEHTYEVLADNGDGTAMITIDGNVPTELVKGENVQIPYSLADLQQMKDLEDQKRLEAAKAQREQMEKERAAQQTQEIEQTQPSFDFNQILNDNGNVVLADVLGKDGNTKYPNSQLFLIRDSGAKAKVVELTSDGSLIPHAVNKKDVRTATTMTLDEYKQAFAGSSTIEENSGAIEGDRGGIEVNDELPPVPDNVTINGDGTYSVDGAVQGGENNAAPAEQTEQTPAMTLEDGTIVPMLEDGNPDFSKLTADQTAELYDSQFGEDADSVISGWVSDAKKALDKANNMTVKGKNFVEQKAAKEAKEKAIADAQAAYDSAVAIRDAYNSRQLAKVEDTAEGRKNLIDKARRKFARLKSAVKDDAEAVSQLYKDVVGSLLHRLYDSTGIDVTDTIPLTAEEYVASNLGAHSLNYEGTETSKGVKQETGLSREDFAKTQLLAADGKGTTIDNLVHSLWENRPSNLESLNTQDIRNALIGVLTSGFKASEARNYIENLRIAQAENFLEEQKKAADNAAFAEQQTAPAEQQTETAPESEEKTGEENSDEINDKEDEKINEQTNENINEKTKFPDKLREGSKAIEVPEDATDDAPLGKPLDESDLRFSSKGNDTQQTITDSDADVEKNKVDDVKVVDNIVGKKTRKTLEKIAKIMGANIQWLYSNNQFNGRFDEKTNTIYLTLDSSITEGVQFIFGHEMTHEMRTMNPAAYDELKTLVKDMMGEDVFSAETDKMQQRYKKGGARYWNNRNAIEEEVVADQLGVWIRDANYAHTLLLKMSHPLLARLHEIVNRFLMALRGIEISDDMNLILRSIEQAYVKTAKGEITNPETGEDVSFSLRQKPEPKKKGIGYKVFVLKDGKLYPPMVANPDGAATPVGVWLDADAAPIAGESKTGRPQVKQGGKGTQGGSGKLAYRPGWHLGVVPYAIQFNRKDAEGNKTLFPKNFVFAEVEYAADVDYQEEARQEGINPSGKYQHSLAGLKHLPTDGYYMYRTNPNPETDPWVITGAMKVNRILTRAEQAELVKNAGREPQQIQEGDIVTDDVVNSINQEIAAAPKFSLKVYHGSGADFTEFDFDHMGEGAGSQAFGWGGYVTSSKKIGKSYAEVGQQSAESRRSHYDDTPLEAAVGSILGQEMYNYMQAKTFEQKKAQAIKNAENSIASYSEMLKNSNDLDEKSKKFLQKSIENDKKELEVLRTLTEEQYKEEYIKQGRAKNLYEVDIPDDNGSNYLDFENPMSEEQINAVRGALVKNGVDVPSWEKRGFKLDLPFKDVYAAVLPMMMRCEPKEVSKFLSSLGFTGIKYPAGTIMGGAEVGDTNYVIFNPEDMKITEHTKFSIKTYHGSQASFDKFDHSFMGSGEGAQAYGWGTYVSEVEGIAKAYAKQNAAKHGMPREYKVAQLHLNHAKFEYDKVQRAYDNSKAYIDSLKEDLQNYRESIARKKEKVAYFAQNNMPETVDKLLKQIKRTEDTIKLTENDINMRTNDLEGWKPKLEEVKKKYEEEQKKFDAIPKPQIERNLYSVDIPDDTGENYIGWDEKMTPRMRDIRKEILEDNGYKLVDSDEIRDYFEDRDGKEYELFKEQYKTGGTFYEELAKLLHSQKLASLALKEYGFDGVKVIAQRNAGGNKEGKMNYVIFDENNAQITSHTKFSLRLKSAIEETETNPSDAQKESGNYKKGHIKFGGYDYTIENPKGSTRSGKDADGKEWKVTMHDTYGYIRGKFGKDGDHLDMFINDKADLDNWNGDVFVVDQVNPDGSFDEHKVMYGYDSMDDAKKAYLANYSDGWKGLGNITGASKAEFDKWLDTSNRKLKPFADYAKVKFSLKKDGMRSLLDVDGKPVVVREENGNVDLNYRTWQDEKELVRDALVTDAGLEEDEADAMIAQADVVADAMKSYMDKYPRFRDYQYAPAGNHEIIRDNGDYLSWDYSFNCIKKDAMNAVMDKLVSLGKSSHLGVTQVEAIKKILQKHKFLTPCVMCYVEGKRKVLKQSKADAQKWNSVREYAGLENKEMGEPTELTDEQQTALKNLSNGKAHIEGIDDYSVQKIANLMLDNDILRGNLNYEWMMSPSSFTQMYNKFGNTDLMKYMTLGQYRGKQLLEAIPFSINNIPRELYLKMYSALELKERGGLRQFSYEDARAMMFFDYYTQFLLMQGARSPEHLYTKRPFMPEMFGKTGAMINQSLIVDVWGGDKWHQDALGLSDSEYDSWLRENAGFIPRGALPADNADYKEGSTELVPAWSVESFPLDKAMENIHNRDFKGNVGNTIVAPSHKFIQWALDNPDIHMILAYHAAGGSPIMKSLSGYDKVTAMDDGYHTLGTDGKAIKTIEDKLTGVEISGGALQWNRLLRKNGYDAKKAAQTYLDFCKENGFTPMFNYEGVVDHPNYYKMLTDFRVYDEDGKSIRQKGVKAVLPDNWQEILNKYLEQEQTSSEQVSKVTLDENIMKEIDAATKFTSIELEERDSIMSLLQKIYGKGNVEVLGQNEFDVSLDGATSDGRAQMLRDMGGMVYGYAAGNRIVLNEYVFNANTPLHEHAHLYMKVLSAFNPRLYQRGMELWRDTPQWNDAKSDIERLGEEPTDDRVFSECMAQFTGTANEDIISKVTGVTDKNWIQKALEWMKDMWDGVKSAFKRWTKGDLDALTADDFAHLPLRAFYDTEERNAYIKNVKALNDAGGFDGSIRFSLKSMMAKPEGWKQANKKAIHIAEAIERDPKFSLKNLDGTLIKAGTYFSGGGLVEEGDYNYVIFDENNANIVGNTRFSLRYDKFEHDLNQWKKDNNLPKDAQRPTIPQRNAGESAVDFLRRVDEYRKQMALWKTAPTYEQHLLSDDTALGEFNRELQRGSVLKRIAFQDSMLAIRKAQEAIMKEVGVDRLNMAEDAYTAENRSHGKGKNEFEEYNNEFLQPLRKAYHQMKKVLGDSYDNVRVYMMAKHGLERDAQMAFKKSLEADYEDVNQRSAAYKAYKNDLDRVSNDADLEFGRVDFITWRQKDNALRGKYSPSYMDYRYDDNGIAYDYSGLSSLFDGSDFEEAAHRLVRDVETKHLAEVQALWNATNAATKKILRDGFKAGMMSKDAYEYVKGMYSHYIPLRGWDGTTADQVWDYIGGGKGAFNQTLKTAHGRTSIADDPIAYIENMAESGILLNNKNWVKQHLMLLAQNHPTSLLTLSKAWYVKSTDANGNEEWIPATPQITSQMNSNQVKAAIDAFEQKMEQMAQTGDATQQRDGLNIAYPQTHSEEREHEVRVMKDGEEYVIYVNGDPQLAQAMNNTRAHRVREIQSGKLDRAAAWLGRKMAAAYTSLSPLFIPSNYFRDLTMTLASTAIREDAKYNYLLRKNLATSWNLGFMLRDYQIGKLREKVSNGNATPKEQMFYDFMMNGGETGFVSSLDVEDLKKKFKNDLKDLDRWKANPVKVGHTIMDAIEFLNRAIEDSNRFAVYMTSIQYGRSIDEAVNDAKDVTLNFNRKGTGEYGWQMVRNLYLFINPAVQSLQTLGALAKHHPFKFTAVTASWLASGVLVPIVNAALMSLLGGDDDKDKYWQFTKWDRRNNLIMWVPFTHEYVKIPLAQEFRAFYGIGDMIASKMMGGELAEESWSQYAEDMLGQVVDMLPLDPTGYDGNIAVSLMPNAIRPVFELAFNVDFTGKPLFKDTEYNKYDPNFTKAYVGTPDWLVRVSKMVNSIGNDYPDVQQNAIDAFGDPRYNLNNPAVVDHVLSSYLGGAYTMGSQVLGVLTKLLNDPKEIKMADIPLVSKFVSNPDDRPVTKKQGDEFWNMKENHDRAANTLSKLKKQAKVDGDYTLLEQFYGSEEYKQYKQEDVKVKKYEEDKKKERAEESGEEYRPHKLNAEDIYKAHATPKDDFEDLKLKQLFTKLNGFKTSYDLLVDTAPSQSEGYYNTNKVAIDAIDEISLDKQEISELKKGFLEDGKDSYNDEDMKQIRKLRKKILVVLENANRVVVGKRK